MVSLLKFSLGLALRQIRSMRMARLAGRGVLLGVFLYVRCRNIGFDFPQHLSADLNE